MKALISPNEIIKMQYVTEWNLVDGNYVATHESIEECTKIAQVEEDSNIFEIASPLHWVDCPSDCTPNTYYYKNNVFTKMPEDAVKPE